MKFYSLTGKMALGSRLRRLADVFTNEASKVYQSYDVEIDPKWFPVFFMLTQEHSSSISTIARNIGHSHPSVSKIVKEMAKAGIVETSKDKDDSRINLVKLSAKGIALQPKLDEQCSDVESAVEQLIDDAGIDLWAAIEQVELQLEQSTFFKRVRKERTGRESGNVKIVPYESKHKTIYAQMNKAWIEKHWQLEQADIDALEHPELYVLKKGGKIFLAEYGGEIVGSCAMIRMDNHCYELAKMAVKEQAKGKGVGYLLGKEIIKQAKVLGAQKVYLESNTLLVPAINLYKKLGFIQVSGISSPYERCNIQMELQLSA